MIGFFIGSWFLLDQIGEMVTQLTASQAGFEKIVQPISQALSSIDNICSGGSGITAAFAPLLFWRKRT